MSILVLGGGGREHALAWKLAQSPRCEKLYLHPGNAGTMRTGFHSLDEAGAGRDELVVRAREKQVRLVIVGPEVLLAEGYADAFRAVGIPVVGPDRAAAQLETSKVYAKEFMRRAGVPTAPFFVADHPDALVAHVPSRWPTVLKLDGLAAGKGVVIANQPDDIRQFAHRIWTEKEFGQGPHRVVVEGFLPGVELSYMGLCDGERFIPLSSATDFKRVGDGDQGPNTGGMGAVSPSPYFSEALAERIRGEVTDPILRQMKQDRLSYRGVLYVGLMISPRGEPFVLEFNARFGDPETQAILLRLESDFVELMEHTAKGTLRDCPAPRWSHDTSIYVVAAAEGYPQKIAVGDEISGLENLPAGAEVFFSGVRANDGGLSTNGGRVLGVGAVARDVESARLAAYGALAHIRWRGMHFRRDIGLTTAPAR